MNSVSMENSIKLTLDENNSYYFDKFFTLENKEFSLLGKNNTIYIKLKGSFLFIQNENIIFSRLIFIHEEEGQQINPFIFSFDETKNIIFEVFFFFFHIKY